MDEDGAAETGEDRNRGSLVESGHGAGIGSRVGEALGGGASSGRASALARTRDMMRGACSPVDDIDSVILRPNPSNRQPGGSASFDEPAR